MHAPGALRFREFVWSPGRDDFEAALRHTESAAERTELVRLTDLAVAGRLTRRTLPDGSAIYPVVKAAVGIRAIDEKTRRVTVAASDATVDRYGDTIAVAGWVTDNFEKNPVVLTDHDYTVGAIVGQSLGHRVEGGQFLSDHLFNPASADPWAEYVFQKILARSLRAVSVGFRARKWAKRVSPDTGEWTGGYDYLEQELLEESWVAVPANPNAVIPADKSLEPAAIEAPGPALRRLQEAVRSIGLLGRMRGV